MSRRKKHTHHRRAQVFSLLATAVAAVFFGFSDWYVHQPNAWQQQRTKTIPSPLASAFLRFGNEFADATDALGLTGRDAVADFKSTFSSNRTACAGLPKRLPKGPAPNDIVVLHKHGFTVGYSPSLRHPVWAAYRTFPAARGEPPPRPSSFRPDPAAPRSPQHKDYTKSGYDRGHMAPNLAIATRYGKAAQKQTFLTSNICPQRPSLNQGPWCDLEFRIAELWPFCCDDVWVIVGAVNDPGDRRLASGIDVPSAFYQIVVSQKNGRLRAFAVCMPQSIHRHTPVRTTLISIDNLEKMTGFDFLSDLPDDVETRIESQTPTRLWPTGLVGYCRLIRERLRALRY